MVVLPSHPLGLVTWCVKGNHSHTPLSYMLMLIQSLGCLHVENWKRVDSVSTLNGLTKAAIKERYQSVFVGLGKLGKYHIML